MEVGKVGYGCRSLPWAMHDACVELQSVLVKLPEFEAVRDDGYAGVGVSVTTIARMSLQRCNVCFPPLQHP